MQAFVGWGGFAPVPLNMYPAEDQQMLEMFFPCKLRIFLRKKTAKTF
jgi:hypothetical protein